MSTIARGNDEATPVPVVPTTFRFWTDAMVPEDQAQRIKAIISTKLMQESPSFRSKYVSYVDTLRIADESAESFVTMNVRIFPFCSRRVRRLINILTS